MTSRARAYASPSRYAGFGAVRHHGVSTGRPRYGVTIRSTPSSCRPFHSCHQAAVPGLGALVITGRQRTRSDERHLAAENVENVRDLIEREAPQDTAHPRDPRVVADLEQRTACLVRLLQRVLIGRSTFHHRAEL